MNPEKKFKVWLPFLISLGIALGIFIGVKYSDFTGFARSGGVEKLEGILNYIDKSYVDNVDENRIIEDALPHIVQELDPHSVYIPASEMKRVSEDLEGHFSGIGVSFYILKDTIVVTGIIPGGPSQAAGIKQWDRIVKVNDTLIAGQKIDNNFVLTKLRGEKGSQVRLGILRDGKQNIHEITVTRGEVPVNSVQTSFIAAEAIGYIKVGTFGLNTFNEFITAISKLKNQGAQSFVIDLRGNSGGSMETVVFMVNEFFHKGKLIVYAEGKNFPRQDRYADGSGTCKEDRIVLLIDELSASASEIFAGAIQDHDRGLVIGRRSFGKGLVQNQRQFRDGSAIRLTVARYYTPSGRSIQRKYEKGKYNEYEMDAYNRYFQGDYLLEDSAAAPKLEQFKTEAGRTVYSGEGIAPDIFVPRDTTGINSYYNSLNNKGLIGEYAFLYSDLCKNKLSAFKTPRQLIAYLYRQPLLANLVSYADNKGIRPRPYYIEESRKLFERDLISYIVRNFFGEDAFYEHFLQTDNLLAKAVRLIEEDYAQPQAVAEEKYKTFPE